MLALIALATLLAVADSETLLGRVSPDEHAAAVLIERDGRDQAKPVLAIDAILTRSATATGVARGTLKASEAHRALSASRSTLTLSAVRAVDTIGAILTGSAVDTVGAVEPILAIDTDTSGARLAELTGLTGSRVTLRPHLLAMRVDDMALDRLLLDRLGLGRPSKGHRRDPDDGRSRQSTGIDVHVDPFRSWSTVCMTAAQDVSLTATDTRVAATQPAGD